MTLLFVSFIAGILTTFAPCILPLLPIIIGGGISGNKDTRTNTYRILVIILSLAISVIIFTLLLKATTALLGVPQEVWRYISGGIVLLLGINYLFPQMWQTVALTLGLSSRSNSQLSKASSKKGFVAAILTGAALGPVFTSCSPTYALIVAAVLPASFAVGLLYLVAYVFGMCLVLFLVAFFGNIITKRLGWALNEHSVFNKAIGIIFIVVAIGLFFGVDKQLQSYLLEKGAYDGTSQFEQLFTQR